MEPKRNSAGKNNGHFSSSDYLRDVDKLVGTLTMRAMAEGNAGDFNMAFSDMELALWLSQSLGKKCLESVLLNNLGLLYTMNGSWDSAMLTFDRSMEIATESCPSNNSFLTTLKKNISSLFDPKIATPGNPRV